MIYYLPDMQRISRWQKLREQIQFSQNSQQRLDLLRTFGDEIRRFLPDAAKAATVDRDDLARALEVATIHGAIIGSWLDLDPENPDWPGRDRLFIVRRDDLITTCCVFAGLGFFDETIVGSVIDYVDSSGSKAFVPGIEAPGAPVDAIPDLLWESAVESARSKKKWREANINHSNWADEKWAASPAVWRSCAILDTADPVTEKCRYLAARDDDAAAGLVVIIKVPRSEAPQLADSWAECGWDTQLKNRSDCLGIYQTLAEATFERPLAILITVGAMQTPQHISKTIIRRRESGLLGEMSDEQFNALISDCI